ncbi:MAG: hypothetical protein J6W76_06015 [Spirochaetales bacterium]|nr:hypothetical protein [Spirochaetales bacterium]
MNDNNISEVTERKQAEQAARAKFCEANETTCRIIEEYITGGYVNTLAKLLVYVGTERAKNILSKMAEADRQRIETAYKALADKKVTDPDVISEAGKVLKNAGFYGNNAANAILQNMTMEQEIAVSDLLSEMFEVNPLLTMNVEAKIYSFDIIADMYDRDIQKLLREIDITELTKALKGAGETVQDKIFRNMSHRAATMLREDMEYMGVVRKTDVFEAQRHIISVLKRLEEDGDIILIRNNVEGVS